jgi:uncharacterized protein (TIGR02246 family)
MLPFRICAVTFLLAAYFATAQQGSKDEAAVRAMDSSWSKAVTAVDLAALDKMLAPDLIYTHSDGRVDTKQSYVDSLKSGAMKYASAEQELVTVRVYGNAAIVTEKVKAVAVTNGNSRPLNLSVLRFYTKRDGAWQLTAHQSTRLAQ